VSCLPRFSAISLFRNIHIIQYNASMQRFLNLFLVYGPCFMTGMHLVFRKTVNCLYGRSLVCGVFRNVIAEV
jgi:hypothetical protein